MTISPERERQLLASVEYPPAALRAIQFLLGRVRELEAQAELAESFVEICEVCGCEDGCECPARVRELEKREAELMESLVEVLAGWRCLLNQQGGIVTNDSDILDRAHKALEEVR